MSSTRFDSFQEIEDEWEDLLDHSPVNTLFLTPQWQEVWWNTLGNCNQEMSGFYIRTADGMMAIAPLARRERTLYFLGNQETFDYNDFMIRPGYEETFFDTLLTCMETQGCNGLELYSLMENSPTLEHLPPVARRRGFAVEVSEEDVSPGLTLPGTWDTYLADLSKKDRHELRRKFRRLDSLENWRWYSVSEAAQVQERLDDFFELMRQSREEKDEYMNPQRESFFRTMAQRTAQLGLLKLFFLEMGGAPVATALCFDYAGSRLLYNSGYDPAQNYYSVGLLLNALCLQDAIEQGQEYFDFLRGPEPYKYHLGGQDRTLYQMAVRKS